MSDLEDIKSISILTWKSIDKMSNKEKKEALNNLLDDIDNLWASEWLNKNWWPLSEEQKLNIYNAWNISKMRMPLKSLNISPKDMFKWSNSKEEKWNKNMFKYFLLKRIAPACRFCVELWILSKPEWLTEKQLRKDVKKDAIHIKNSLAALDLACYTVPELKPVQPYIKMIKPYVKWYKKHWTEVLISRLDKKALTSVQEDTNYVLLDALSDNENYQRNVA